MNTLALRLSLPVAMLGLTAIGAATPAHAAPEAPPVKVEISGPDRVVTAAGGSKTFAVEIGNIGTVAATGLVAEWATATSPVNPKLGLKPPADCSELACTVGELAPGARKTYTFKVQPAADLPTAGASLTISVHDAGGTVKESKTVTVSRAAKGIDLETQPIAAVKVAPGTSAAIPIAVRNNGDKTATGVAIALTGPRYISFPEKYGNCELVKEHGLVCFFEVPVAPGATFTISSQTPLTVAADPVTPAPADFRAVVTAYGTEGATTAPELAAAARRVARQPGTKLQLVPVARTLAVDQSEQNAWDNAAPFTVQVSVNPADTVAVGGTFAGKVGDTRAVKVGIRNDGAATLLGPSKRWTASAKVRIPSGLKLTKVDKRCVPNGDGEPSWDQPGRVSGHDYLCVTTKQLAKGGSELFSFTAKIENGRNEDKGSITVAGGVQDTKTTNNTAKIEVKLTRTNATGGSGGGGLPITGAPTGLVAGSGLLLVLAGALTMFLTRRRQTA